MSSHFSKSGEIKLKTVFDRHDDECVCIYITYMCACVCVCLHLTRTYIYMSGIPCIYSLDEGYCRFFRSLLLCPLCVECY